jgi:glycosyltransferase involved in cell wall biosynthesis
MRKAMIRLGADSLKIKMIYFGVDTQKFSPGEKSELVKKNLEIFDFPTVISLRNLEQIYDIGTLIKAAPLVIKEIPRARFIIAGEGSEKEKLKNLAKSLKVSENIKFIGWITGEELPQYLRAADVYVSTSLSDAGLSSSTAEAMACGLPVVITDFGDNKEWIKDGESGFLIPLRNPEVLAEKIICLLKNKNLRLNFGEISRKIIEEKNNYFKEMGKIGKFYEEIIKKN